MKFHKTQCRFYIVQKHNKDNKFTLSKYNLKCLLAIIAARLVAVLDNGRDFTWFISKKNLGGMVGRVFWFLMCPVPRCRCVFPFAIALVCFYNTNTYMLILNTTTCLCVCLCVFSVEWSGNQCDQ